jgi:hypothetical protein
MYFRSLLKEFCKGRDLVVIIKCPDDPDHEQQLGKYLFGMHLVQSDLMAVVLDSEIPFHPAIARKYRIVPLGGGYFRLNQAEATLHIGGRSETYGAEPDRQLTKKALDAVLPEYRVLVD